MKHWHALVLFVLGLVAAGALSGAVIADVTTSTSTTTVETTTAATTTTTTTSTAPSSAIPSGVRVAGVRVGGLAPRDAVAAVQTAFAKPLAVIVDGKRTELDPTKVASVYITTAVARARISASGTNIGLVVAVKGAPLRAWVASLAKRFDRKRVDATLKLKDGKPSLTTDRPGRSLDQARLRAKIVTALRANTRLPVGVHTKKVPPTVAVTMFGKVIVINRSLNRLYLFSGEKLVRTFQVATGQAIYPTPPGRWHIVVKWKNPWWYPPTQDSWARGLQPVPPGPGNPLGTRWMGLDAPGVGIHGTDEPASIGYSASHGCIRMQVPDAEWLFDRVDVGTTVFII